MLSCSLPLALKPCQPPSGASSLCHTPVLWVPKKHTSTVNATEATCGPSLLIPIHPSLAGRKEKGVQPPAPVRSGILHNHRGARPFGGLPGTPYTRSSRNCPPTHS